MNFFRTVFSLCSGTELFPKMLSGMSVFRAFLHLVLLLILCTVGVVISTWLLNRDNVNLVCERFVERTGGFELRPEEIVIGKDKNRTRGYKLSDQFRFDYYAKTDDLTEKNLLDKKAVYGVFCFPSGAVFWIRDPQQEVPMFRLMVLPAHVIYEMAIRTVKPETLLKLQKQSTKELYTPANACRFIKKDLNDRAKDTEHTGTKDKKTFRINMDLLASQALAVIILFHISAYLVEVLLSLLLVLVFFSLAQKFRFSGAPKKLPFATILTATVYATFPAIIAATFFQMMQLHLLSFQTIFFIVFFVYQLFAFNRIFEAVFPRTQDNNNDPDDDF
ncbi:MAG: hypothetical protein IKB16_09665 [Lentisphaeria bacterium]|nr:hypothetical protein [Lentisphaeria bacterium]